MKVLLLNRVENLVVKGETAHNMCNFSFCHNHFKSCLLQKHQKASM